jgi:hypothetical protein
MVLYRANHLAISLQRLLQVKEAHSFSITGLAINHDRSLLISASAENKCRAVVLPQVYEPSEYIYMSPFADRLYLT